VRLLLPVAPLSVALLFVPRAADWDRRAPVCTRGGLGPSRCRFVHARRIETFALTIVARAVGLPAARATIRSAKQIGREYSAAEYSAGGYSPTECRSAE
jgi:hypothetical protein